MQIIFNVIEKIVNIYAMVKKMWLVIFKEISANLSKNDLIVLSKCCQIC